MKFWYLTLLLSLASIEGISQKDSLLRVWNNPNFTSEERFDALNKLNKRYYLFKYPDSSFYISEQAYDFAKSEGLSKRMARALNLQGISLDLIGNYPLAIEYYLKSLKILDSIDVPDDKANCYLNLGLIYNHINDEDKALEYYNKAQETFELNDNKSGKSRVLLNKGSLFLELEMFDEAEKLYNQSYQISNQINDIHSKSEIIYAMGTLYLIKDELMQASVYFDSCLVQYNNINNSSGEAQTLNVLSKVYYKQNNIDKAVSYAQESLKIAKESHDLINIEQAAASLYSYYELQNNYQKALEMHRLYVNSRDSSLNNNIERTILKKEFEYELERKVLQSKVEHEKARSRLKLKHLKERITIIISVVVTLILLFLYIRHRYIKNIKEKNELLEQIEALKNDLLVKKYIKESSSAENQGPLDQTKIESAILKTLNDTDWNILTAICDTPTLSYDEIAKKVFLSREGVSSSLRKMYRLFELDNVKNKKLALVMKAVEFSR